MHIRWNSIEIHFFSWCPEVWQSSGLWLQRVLRLSVSTESHGLGSGRLALFDRIGNDRSIPTAQGNTSAFFGKKMTTNLNGNNPVITWNTRTKPFFRFSFFFFLKKWIKTGFFLRSNFNFLFYFPVRKWKCLTRTFIYFGSRNGFFYEFQGDISFHPFRSTCDR